MARVFQHFWPQIFAHRHHAKHVVRLVFDVAPHNSVGPRFQHVAVAFVERDVVVARGGEPRNQARKTARVTEQKKIAGPRPVGAREGAAFVRRHIIRTTPHAFDDFAAQPVDKAAVAAALGLA